MSKAPQKKRSTSAATAAGPAVSGVKSFMSRAGEYLRDVHQRPYTNYFMILLMVALLSGIGVVMVFSSSMTHSVAENNSVWAIAVRQVAMVVGGLIAMIIAMRIRPATLQRLSPWIAVIAIALLVLVLIPGIGTGREEVGSQSWIVLGPLRLQPSEFAKVGIAIWGASQLSAPEGERPPMQRFVQFGLVSGLMVALIGAEGDMGMAITFMIMVCFVLYFAGVNIRFVLGASAVIVVVLIALATGGGFRGNRFAVYYSALFGKFDDTRGTAFQSYQGFLSLADGSLFGVGIGQSRAKWFYLPEAKNDFIFAIVGEELGFLGGAMVIAAFTALGFYGFRCAIKSKSSFLGLMAASLTAGVAAQAFINVGYVVGLFPVTGIQLPMISAGGTSALITLASMGLLASAARYEPEAVSAMQSYGRPAIDHLLHLPEPDPSDLEASQLRKPRPTRPAGAVPVTQRRPHRAEEAVAPTRGASRGARVTGGTVERDRARTLNRRSDERTVDGSARGRRETNVRRTRRMD